MQAQVPKAIADYFGISQHPEYREHPLIHQAFTPSKGWKRLGFNKRVSRSWVRKMRAQGVTSIAVQYAGRVADFSVREVLR